MSTDQSEWMATGSRTGSGPSETSCSARCLLFNWWIVKEVQQLLDGERPQWQRALRENGAASVSVF